MKKNKKSKNNYSINDLRNRFLCAVVSVTSLDCQDCMYIVCKCKSFGWQILNLNFTDTVELSEPGLTCYTKSSKAISNKPSFYQLTTCNILLLCLVSIELSRVARSITLVEGYPKDLPYQAMCEVGDFESCLLASNYSSQEWSKNQLEAYLLCGA